MRNSFLLWFLLLSGSLAAQDFPGEVEGVITHHAGITVQVEAEGEELPAPGTILDMSKHFVEQWGKTNISGWMSTAQVRVTKVEGQVISMDIIEEKSHIEVNGEQVDHFKEGKRVKLVWPTKEPWEHD